MNARAEQPVESATSLQEKEKEAKAKGGDAKPAGGDSKPKD